ncbi:MAG: putative cadmium-transporting ATPase [Syntrophorhabdaceae bacterium PtaU1.Bin034]|nr:MAG: putative cadmium-transporting ATPase [Syntrophorhabdaceae bacterium PtaU1.Bin034]
MNIDADAEKVLTVKGMDCADCAAHVQKEVSKVAGVASAEVSLATGKLKVIPAGGLLDEARIIEAVRRAGYDVEAEDVYRGVLLNVEGMDCADEEVLIRKKMEAFHGIRSFDIYLVSQQLKVTYDPTLTSVQDIIKSVAETGMRVSMVREKGEAKAAWWRSPQAFLLALCGIFAGIGFLLHAVGFPHLAVKAFFGLAIASGIYYPARMGILALRTLTFNIRLLMTVGAIGAIFLGLWEEAALLVFIYSFGDVLESYAVDRARGSIRALMDLAPKEALVRRNGSEVMLPTEEIVVGDKVIVKPGDRIPMDGTVAAGASFVDQAPITGESIPVEKRAGDEVFAGTINQRGSLEIDVTKRARDTTIARIIHSVEEAQARKSSYQRFGEKFGQYYTPAMFALGLGVALLPPLFLGRPWFPFIYRGLVVFVVSCTCGLALSVPIAVVAAVANGARKGILFKGGAYLEIAQELKAIAFDKTGTLTIGRPVVTDVVPLNGLSEPDVLALAAAIESRSEHPLAEAIVRRALETGVTPASGLTDFEALTGMGVKARLNGKTYLIGTPSLMEQYGVLPESVAPQLARFEGEEKTMVLLAEEQRLLAFIAIADQVRPGAPDTVARLKAAGIHVAMLTGDNEGTARAVAEHTGVDTYLANLLPEQKVEAIKELKERFGKIAMVGDGVNDAPAMAVSDTGIAMGGAGTDVAMETGDIVLMSDDLSRIPYVLSLSRRSINNIRQNTFTSMAIVAFLVPAALIGWIGLVPGLLLNEVSGLIVIVNALRLLR